MFYQGLLVDEKSPTPGFVYVPGGTSVVGCPTRISSNGRAGFTGTVCFLSVEV
jgi:hypothetical protein